MTIDLVCLECGQANRVPAARLDAGPKCAKCGTPLISGEPTDVSYDILAKAVRIDGLPLVVDFWAAWCGPCRMMAPEFRSAASTLKGRARFAKLDTEAYPQSGQRHDIRGIPLLIAFSGGCEVKRQSGAITAPKIVEWASGLPRKQGAAG